MTSDDVRYVAANMRAMDAVEVWNMTGSTPRDGILRAAGNSPASFTITLDDRPAAVCGCTKARGLRAAAAPWLLGTDELEPALLTAGTQIMVTHRMVEGWLQRAGILENWVDPDNTTAIRWIKWLGFTLDPVAPAGLFGKPHRRFWREA